MRSRSQATPPNPFSRVNIDKAYTECPAVFTVSRSLPVFRARVYQIAYEPPELHSSARADRALYPGRDSINGEFPRPIVARFLELVKCNNEYYRSKERIL